MFRVADIDRPANYAAIRARVVPVLTLGLTVSGEPAREGRAAKVVRVDLVAAGAPVARDRQRVEAAWGEALLVILG